MKRKLTRILLASCILGVLIMTAGCTKDHSQKDESKQQTKEESNTVEAAYDENLQAILGEGLIYEILEDSDAMTVATYNDVALEEIVIPDTVVYEKKEYSVTEIAESAFESNALLRKITLPDGMKTVGNSAFYACPELTEVVFSDTITSIGESCFAECPELSQIKLPHLLESIGAEAFCNCVSLQTVEIPASVTMIDRAVFYGCEELTECCFKDGVTQIGNEMFTNCYELSKVEIPDSVKIVGEEAFWYCTSLTEITLPEQISIIGSRAFYSTGITELRLPSELTSITLELLEGMDALQKITVPESKKETYENVFRNYDIEILTD